MAGLVSSVRMTLEGAFHRALEAADPRRAVRAELEAMHLKGPVTVVAIGKAARSMARGAVDVLQNRVAGGVVVSPGPQALIGHIGSGQSETSLPPPSGLRYLEGGHPMPNVASLEAGRTVMVEAARATGTLLVLLSGGASALTEVPVEGLTLADLVTTYRQLLRAGLPIEKINTVRRHLSALKNGGLLAATRAVTVTLLIADVVADASAIGSGPTLADSSTPTDALAIAAEAGIMAMLPEAVIDSLRNSDRPRGPSPPHSWTIVADGTTAASAASDYIRHCGLLAVLDPYPIAGDAAEQGRQMASTAHRSTVIVRHGESVVKVRGESPGGRNQHAALAGAIAVQGQVAVFAALATDGRDGLTDSAGAMVDGETCHRMRTAGIDPEEMLAGCRSHEALAASGDLVITGPTGTNVADLWMAWRRTD